MEFNLIGFELIYTIPKFYKLFGKIKTKCPHVAVDYFCAVRSARVFARVSIYDEWRVKWLEIISVIN